MEGTATRKKKKSWDIRKNTKKAKLGYIIFEY